MATNGPDQTVQAKNKGKHPLQPLDVNDNNRQSKKCWFVIINSSVEEIPQDLSKLQSENQRYSLDLIIA